jgi:hypothetical protein
VQQVRALHHDLHEPLGVALLGEQEQQPEELVFRSIC